jgi:hypothetical protein
VISPPLGPDLTPFPNTRTLIDTSLPAPHPTLPPPLVASASFYMSDLRQRLARLGLSQYLEVFTAEGFDTWDTVLDITESDLYAHTTFLIQAKAHIYPEVFSTSSSGTEGFVVVSFSIFKLWTKAKIVVQKLQRAIAESRGQTSDRPLPIALNRATSAEGSYRSGDESATEGKGKQHDVSTTGATATGTTTKRKYRRHPKVSCALCRHTSAILRGRLRPILTYCLA